MPGSAAPTRPSSSPDLGRIQPQLRDLMALSRPAAALPSWTRSIRARQGGVYLSALKGRGMEYDESRPYQPGDDVRTLDWRVTARTGKPYTKLFREERERPVFLFVDYRRTMFFGTQGVFKSVQAARAAGLLAWKAQQNHDRVGSVIFSERGHHELSPERGRPAAIRFVKQLAEHAPTHAGVGSGPPVAEALPLALTRLRRLAKPGSLLFLLSDFRGFAGSCESELTYLARHNDMMLVLVFDPLEADLPAVHGYCRVSDGTRELALGVGDERDRMVYGERFAARAERIRRFCRNHRLIYTQLATGDEPLPILLRALGMR